MDEMRSRSPSMRSMDEMRSRSPSMSRMYQTPPRNNSTLHKCHKIIQKITDQCAKVNCVYKTDNQLLIDVTFPIGSSFIVLLSKFYGEFEHETLRVTKLRMVKTQPSLTQKIDEDYFRILGEKGKYVLHINADNETTQYESSFHQDHHTSSYKYVMMYDDLVSSKDINEYVKRYIILNDFLMKKVFDTEVDKISANTMKLSTIVNQMNVVQGVLLKLFEFFEYVLTRVNQSIFVSSSKPEVFEKLTKVRETVLMIKSRILAELGSFLDAVDLKTVNLEKIYERINEHKSLLEKVNNELSY
jgi:hypothetical protein